MSQHAERSPSNLGWSCFGAVKTKVIVSNSKWKKAKFYLKKLHDGMTDLLASSSMCVDTLRGSCVMGTGLDLWPEPSRSNLLFGWARWQIRGVTTVVWVALFNYNHISGHRRYHIIHTHRKAHQTLDPWSQSNKWNLDKFYLVLTLTFLAMQVDGLPVGQSSTLAQTEICWLFWMDWIEMLCVHSPSPDDQAYWLWWFLGHSASITMRFTFEEAS